MGDSENGRELSDELTFGEKALAKAVYRVGYDEMDEWKQDHFTRLLDDLPDHMRAGINDELLNKEQMADGMEDVFLAMVDDDDIPEEWKDGAAVFAKGLQKKFDLSTAVGENNG